VVALDEETYRTPPVAGTPAITWTSEIGQVLTAVLAGGAKVVGFDIVFPTSIEQSEIAFGDGTLGARLRGFDRNFLRALALGARDGKVVLGEAQHRDFPIMPSPGQRIAVGQSTNIRSLNVFNDPDDVVRRIPLHVVVDGEPQPSMAVELAARALGTPATMISGSRIPSQIPNTMVLNFDGGADPIPTHSLADLRACIEKGDSEFFRRNFADKVVLIATVLDVEDHQVTSKRFATSPENPRSARCALPAPPPSTAFARDSTPGVYTHATAINNLIRGDALVELGPIGSGAIAFAFASIIAAATLMLPLLAAVPAYLAAALLWTFGAVVAFTYSPLALPLIEPLLAGMVSLGATTGFRFLVADKDRRFLCQSFALYLARNVTIFFSDLAGFSSISEALAPPDLVHFMNEYLSAMSPGAGLAFRFAGDGFGRRELDAVGADAALQIGDDFFGLRAAPMLFEPARRFRQIPANPPDNGGADRADDHHPAPAVEPEDGPRHQLPGQERHHRHCGEHDELIVGEGRPELLLRHQFGHIGIDIHQLDPEPDAGNEPPQIDALRRILKRHDQGADRIPEQREGEDRAAAESIGQPAEGERADEEAQEQRSDETGKAFQIE
jgi:CHASE2 domain-containing sensor protein